METYPYMMAIFSRMACNWTSPGLTGWPKTTDFNLKTVQVTPQSERMPNRNPSQVIVIAHLMIKVLDEKWTLGMKCTFLTLPRGEETREISPFSICGRVSKMLVWKAGTSYSMNKVCFMPAFGAQSSCGFCWSVLFVSWCCILQWVTWYEL